MRKYNYRSTTGDLTFLDTLEVFQFNDSAKFMLESFLSGYDANATARRLTQDFQIDLLAAQNESECFFQELQNLGLGFKATPSPQPLSDTWTPRNAIVHIIQNCNSPCLMCDCWKTKDEVQLKRSDLHKFFQKFKSHGGSEIMISGGEPLLHPELEGIIDDLANCSLDRLLNTNGVLLQKRPWLYEKGIEQLVISMDGVDAESYKFYRGLNAFQHVLKSLELFKKKSPQTQVGARVTLNRSNFNKLPLLFKSVFSSGVDVIGFSPADTGSTSFARTDMNAERTRQLNDQMLPSSEEIKTFLTYFVPGHADYEYINQIFKQGKSQWDADSIINCLKYYERMHAQQHELFDVEPCFFPRLSLLVDYDGAIRSCFYSKNFGQIQKLDSVDWSLSPRLNSLRESGACATCRGRIFCDKVQA